MKKLSKKVNSLEHTIEAYACTCGSNCNTNCYCNCALLFGDKNGTANESRDDGLRDDKQAEATSSNYRK